MAFGAMLQWHVDPTSHSLFPGGFVTGMYGIDATGREESPQELRVSPRESDTSKKNKAQFPIPLQ